MKTIAGIIILFSTIAMQCEKSNVDATSKLDGEWVAKEVFLGDAIDKVCGYENTENPQITIRFSNEKSNDGKYSFSGKSAINNYFGSYELISFDEKTGVGTIVMGPIGSTKMAGPEPLMNCESRYFGYLEQSVNFSITKENGQEVLRLGRFKLDDKPSRDGGTFLIMERL